MGCDTKIYLPPAVRARDVMLVLGILSGGKKTKNYFNHKSRDDSFYVSVDNVKFQPTTYPEYAIFQIKIEDEYINKLNGLDNNGYANPSFFFENEIYPGWKLLTFGSRSYSIEIAKRIVKFFGGIADFNDCDDTKIDLNIRSKSQKWLTHSDNENYESFQNALWNLNKIEK